MNESNNKSNTLSKGHSDTFMRFLYPFAVILCIRFISQISVMLVAMIFRIEFRYSFPVWVKLSISCIGSLVMILVYFLFIKFKIIYFKQQEIEQVPLKNKLFVTFFIGIVFLFFIDLLLIMVSTSMGISFKSSSSLSIVSSNDFMLYLLNVSILAPITEELFFRKVLITYLEKEGLPMSHVLLISVFIFALMHLPNNISNATTPGPVIVAFISHSFAGCILGIVFIKYRKLIWIFIIHGSANLFQFLILRSLSSNNKYLNSTGIILLWAFIILAFVGFVLLIKRKDRYGLDYIPGINIEDKNRIKPQTAGPAWRAGILYLIIIVILSPLLIFIIEILGIKYTPRYIILLGYSFIIVFVASFIIYVIHRDKKKSLYAD